MVTQVTSQGLPVSAGVQAAAGGTSATGGKNPMTQDLQAMQRDPGMQPTSQQQKQGELQFAVFYRTLMYQARMF